MVLYYQLVSLQQTSLQSGPTPDARPAVPQPLNTRSRLATLVLQRLTWRFAI